MSQHSRCRGFTLVELVMVITVLGIVSFFAAVRMTDRAAADAHGFSREASGTGRFHYGRLVLRPVYGDIRRDVFVPLEVQGFTGTTWTTLADVGTCVAAPPAAFAYANASGVLAASGTTPNCASRVTDTVTTMNGRATVPMPHPPNGATTLPSSVTLTLNVLAPASGQTCTAGGLASATTIAMPWLAAPDGAGSHSANPTARVSFGRSRGDTILLRERF